ncbi:hypothetical protein DCC85_21010 [Paenibacillus sp. CAA11]|uniref:DUF4362 domain-containing protein n=1 Tax=Paenibacillus sp. CAA11 TaxID=1532905 RepID=UPI000D36AC7E|nr:DUF4362 domain-containing protein [Paenibacillus sp. CAA11]AWB46400.1 hypothetical protein DCC85_21010 [Paenibacillus sp. CAA11]
MLGYIRNYLFILGALLLVASCGLKEGSTSVNSMVQAGEQPTPSKDIEYTDILDAKQLSISRSLGFGSANPQFLKTYTDPETLAAFTAALKTAERMEGQLDIRVSDYDFILEPADGGQSRKGHLWLDSSSGSGLYMNVSDTGTGYKLTEASARRLAEILGRITYTPAQAEENGDVVITSTGMRNVKVWSEFYQKVSSGEKAKVQVTRYTTEGEPIFDNLEFNGSDLLFQHDSTWDSFGASEKYAEFCKRVEKKEAEDRAVYELGGCTASFRLEINQGG